MAARSGSSRSTSTSSSRLLEEGVELIDVRERDERDDGYIAGSRNIPYRLLPICGADVPTDRPVVTICESGARAGHRRLDPGRERRRRPPGARRRDRGLGGPRRADGRVPPLRLVAAKKERLVFLKHKPLFRSLRRRTLVDLSLHAAPGTLESCASRAHVRADQGCGSSSPRSTRTTRRWPRPGGSSRKPLQIWDFRGRATRTFAGSCATSAAAAAHARRSATSSRRRRARIAAGRVPGFDYTLGRLLDAQAALAAEEACVSETQGAFELARAAAR